MNNGEYKMKHTILAFNLIIFYALFSHSLAEDSMTKADSLFEQRNAIFNAAELLADSDNVNEAISLYQNEFDTNADSSKKQEALWKLLRAYYFKGNFTTKDNSDKKQIFSKGIEIGEKYLDEFPKSAEIHCWLGILWGYWGEVHSTLTAARKGVPGRVKYYAEKTIALDDTCLDGGGYRMLGRLYFKVPRIPLLMNWPSKKKSLEYLEKAYEIAPENMLNKLYLAEVLFANNKDERARKLLTEILNTTEIKHGLAVDTWVKRQAEELMQKYPE
jgi:tetratricopeptide (TPR) repeat protein